MAEIRIAIIGLGKIARDQHVPAIGNNRDFRLAAIVDRERTAPGGLPIFPDHRALIDAKMVDAVAICTPPGPRHGIARECLLAGLDVLLEKPPCATLGELEDLNALARHHARSLFTTWHAQYNQPARLAAKLIGKEGLASLRIDWLEDAEKWHPGQTWIWGPGGFGVFDAGINALSIATMLSRERLLVREAAFVLHEDRQQAIAARLELRGAGGERVSAYLDWRHHGEERWDIDATTQAGTRLMLSAGGTVLRIGDDPPIVGRSREYAEIYERFAALIHSGETHVDAEPLRLVADAFLIGERHAA